MLSERDNHDSPGVPLTSHPSASSLRDVQRNYDHSPYLLSSSSSSVSNYFPTSHDEEEGMKLFIGQIPKHLDEEALRPFFDEFGPIIELTVIRDKNTKVHRGCAFLTYALRQSAFRAIQALHDKVKLPNSSNPLQIRPAESHSERENKIFVGMLPKSVSEAGLHDMFSPFGQLKEIHIIRGPEGQSKGCAFVKFVDRSAAMAAIEELNDTIPEGSARPLVIKFAENKKMRDDELLLTSGVEHYWGPRNEFEGEPTYTASQISYPPQPMENFGSSNPPYYEDEGDLRLHTLSSSNLNRLGGSMISQGPPIPQIRPQSVPLASTPSHGRDKSSNGRPAEGPIGANLFIYHLPRDLTDADLATLFAPFGSVISAKVFVDKKTDESKGFGFVSYSSVQAAAAAIEAMSGFQIGSKRLKVQHKRVGSDTKAMGMPQAMSNYGPTLSYYPNHTQQIPQQHSGYPPPQYHHRIPVGHEPDMYTQHHVDLGPPYDPYAREREGSRGSSDEYQYQYGPPPETLRYAPRQSPYPEEVRYAQPREHPMYGAPPVGRQGQGYQHAGYYPPPPTEYLDSGFSSHFDHSMRLHGPGGGGGEL